MTLFEYTNIAKSAGFLDEYQFAPEEGESPNQVRERVKTFMRELYEKTFAFPKSDTWNVLLVSHAGWIRELIGYMKEDLKCEGIPTDKCNKFGYHDFTPNTG